MQGLPFSFIVRQLAACYPQTRSLLFALEIRFFWPKGKNLVVSPLNNPGSTPIPAKSKTNIVRRGEIKVMNGSEAADDNGDNGSKGDQLDKLVELESMPTRWRATCFLLGCS